MVDVIDFLFQPEKLRIDDAKRQPLWAARSAGPLKLASEKLSLHKWDSWQAPCVRSLTIPVWATLEAATRCSRPENLKTKFFGCSSGLPSEQLSDMRQIFTTTRTEGNMTFYSNQLLL